MNFSLVLTLKNKKKSYFITLKKDVGLIKKFVNKNLFFPLKIRLLLRYKLF